MILLLSFLSGGAALLYEILWTRMLTLAVGGPLAAFTIVVTSFMAGLTAGALFFGRLADRTAHPLRVFGWLQAAIGIAVLLLVYAGDWIRWVLLVLAGPPDASSFLLVETMTTGTLCAVPAFLMGGSLPLLLTASAGKNVSRSRLCGLIAAASAAGAAIGALLAGFVVLPEFGLRNSFRIAAFTNLLIAAAAWLAPGSRREAAAPAAREDPASSSVTGETWRTLALLLVAGVAVTAFESVWARLAFLSFGSSAQAASLVLAAVIAGLAAGNTLGARLAPGISKTADTLAWLVGLAALASIATDPLLARMPWFAALIEQRVAGDPSSGFSVGLLLGLQFLMTTVIAIVPCLLLGAAFPIGFKALHVSSPDGSPLHPGRAAGLAAAATSLGNLLGAPVAYATLLTAAGSREVFLGTTMLLCVSGLVCARVRATRLLSGTGILVVLLFGFFSAWNPDLLSSGPYLYGALYAAAGRGATIQEVLMNRGDLVSVQDGPHALVTVRRSPDGVLSMQVNGKTDASTGGDMKTQILTTQLPLILHTATRDHPARSLLLVGLGSGVSAGSALTHAVETEVVEISPEVSAAATLFGEANGHVMDSPLMRLITGDARSWLLFGNRENTGAYDVIASQPSNPWIAGEASLFTVEFFEIAKRRLAPDGIMCQWVQGYGLDPEDFRSVVRTFATVFKHVMLWEESTSGGDYFLLGSDEPLVIDTDLVREVMQRDGVAGDLARVEIYEPADLLASFVMDTGAVRAFTRGAPIQTEDRLALEFTAPGALRSDTLGSILRAIEPHRLEPSVLAEADPALSRDLAGRAKRSRNEREWAAGLGLLTTRRINPELMKGISYLRAGMRDHALRSVEGVVRRNPDDRMPRILLAHIAMALGQTERATRELATVVALHPEDANVRLFLSRALFASGQHLEALAHGEQVRLMAPDLAEAASDQCAMLLFVDDLPSAEAACREALHLDADLPAANANLGLVMKRRGRWSEAERFLLRALELDLDLDDARYNLATFYEQRGRPNEGLRTLTPLLTLSSSDPQVFRLAARLALDTGETRQARNYIDRSLALDPENSESRRLERRIPARPDQAEEE